jgi:hypothetical protein
MAKKGRPKKALKAKGKVKVDRPRQKRFPTMEDDKIQAIEDAAMDYAAARDKRLAAGIAEGQTKQLLLAQMKKEGKKKYVRGEIFAEITPEGEKLKVRIGKAGGDE